MATNVVSFIFCGTYKFHFLEFEGHSP